MAEAAKELRFDSVWATEHIIVGPEAVTPYGRVYDPLMVSPLRKTTMKLH
jgi:hypothetical protein